MPSDPLALLDRAKTIAVIGCSATPGKDAHEVPRFMADHYEVFPVNPSASEIFGLKVHRTLAEVPTPVDIVNVFRPSAEAPEVARQAVAAGAKALWLQTGIASDEARRIATEAGLEYVEDACIRTLVQRLHYVRAQRG